MVKYFGSQADFEDIFKILVNEIDEAKLKQEKV